MGIGDTDAGVEAQNNAHNAYLALESAENSEGQDELVEEMVKHWKDQGKKVSRSKGQKSTAQILGVEAKVVTWNTSDEDGPVTATLTIFQIDGVYFLLSQIITKEADRGSADKLKKAVASLALVGGGKAVASAPTAPKEAAPAKPAAPPAPAKPAASEAPAVASAKPAAPAAPPSAAKPAAGAETVMYPKENPILSFKKPADWSIAQSPRGAWTVGRMDSSAATTVFSITAITKEKSDSELQADLKGLSQVMVTNDTPAKGFKLGALQDVVLGPFKGFVIEMRGENKDVGGLVVRQHVLRNAKGKPFFFGVISPGPIDAEARAFMVSLASVP